MSEQGRALLTAAGVLAFMGAMALVALWSKGWLLSFLMPMVVPR